MLISAVTKKTCPLHTQPCIKVVLSYSVFLQLSKSLSNSGFNFLPYFVMLPPAPAKLRVPRPRQNFIFSDRPRARLDWGSPAPVRILPPVDHWKSAFTMHPCTHPHVGILSRSYTFGPIKSTPCSDSSSNRSIEWH
jgi:hypothetical protein